MKKSNAVFDAVSIFVSDCCSASKFGTAGTSELWSVWCEWVHAHPQLLIGSCSQQTFGRHLRRLHPHLVIRQGTNGRRYEGIALLNRQQIEATDDRKVVVDSEVLIGIDAAIEHVGQLLKQLHHLRAQAEAVKP